MLLLLFLAAQLFVILLLKSTFLSLYFPPRTPFLIQSVKIKNTMKHYEENATMMKKSFESVKMESEVFATHSNCHSRLMTT